VKVSCACATRTGIAPAARNRIATLIPRDRPLFREP
jgi:hypothetical protein